MLKRQPAARPWTIEEARSRYTHEATTTKGIGRAVMKSGSHIPVAHSYGNVGLLNTDAANGLIADVYGVGDGETQKQHDLSLLSQHYSYLSNTQSSSSFALDVDNSFVNNNDGGSGYCDVLLSTDGDTSLINKIVTNERADNVSTRSLASPKLVISSGIRRGTNINAANGIPSPRVSTVKSVKSASMMSGGVPTFQQPRSLLNKIESSGAVLNQPKAAKSHNVSRLGNDVDIGNVAPKSKIAVPNSSTGSSRLGMSAARTVGKNRSGMSVASMSTTATGSSTRGSVTVSASKIASNLPSRFTSSTGGAKHDIPSLENAVNTNRYNISKQSSTRRNESSNGSTLLSHSQPKQRVVTANRGQASDISDVNSKHYQINRNTVSSGKQSSIAGKATQTSRSNDMYNSGGYTERASSKIAAVSDTTGSTLLSSRHIGLKGSGGLQKTITKYRSNNNNKMDAATISQNSDGMDNDRSAENNTTTTTTTTIAALGYPSSAYEDIRGKYLHSAAQQPLITSTLVRTSSSSLRTYRHQFSNGPNNGNSTAAAAVKTTSHHGILFDTKDGASFLSDVLYSSESKFSTLPSMVPSPSYPTLPQLLNSSLLYDATDALVSSVEDLRTASLPSSEVNPVGWQNLERFLVICTDALKISHKKAVHASLFALQLILSRVIKKCQFESLFVAFHALKENKKGYYNSSLVRTSAVDTHGSDALSLSRITTLFDGILNRNFAEPLKAASLVTNSSKI